VDEEKAPCHVTGPLTLPPAFANESGTGNANPVRKISSLPVTGTVVFQVLLPVSNVVDAQTAFGSNVMWALGTATVYGWSAVKEIEDGARSIVAPELGIPLTAKFALNQIKEPAWIGVPLKFEVFEDVAGPHWAHAAPEATRHKAAQITYRLAIIQPPLAQFGLC
jgi:hypothetical protein